MHMHALIPSSVHALFALKKILSAMLLCGAAMSACAADQGIDPSALPNLASSAEAPAPERFAHPDGLLDAAALSKLLDIAGAKTVVLDARDESAFKLGHIPGARNLQSDLLHRHLQ